MNGLDREESFSQRLRTGMTVAGGRYWVALCLASLLGADVGDLVAHDMHLGHWMGVPPLLLVMCGTLRMQRRSAIRTGAWFWSAVVLVRAMATNLADLASHDLHLGQPAMIAILLVAMVAVARGANPLRTGVRFWCALFLAGTLGTILGDDASHAVGLVAASSGLGAVLGAGFLLTARTDKTRPPVYWGLVVLARTAGTSIADLMADRSGLGLAGSAAVIVVLFVMAVGLRGGRKARGAAPGPRQRLSLWKPVV